MSNPVSPLTNLVVSFVNIAENDMVPKPKKI